MLPQSFVERMKELLKDSDSFFESFEREPYKALRVNRLKYDKDVTELPFKLEPVPWAKDGYFYDSVETPGKHVLHEAGAYYIQEPSAMTPVSVLDVQPKDKVLDLCAAPGGKSTQICAASKGEGLIVCNEINPKRSKILSENIERMGIRNAVVLNESPENLSKVFTGFFDKILVDAPCSGEGMFRKNEDAIGEWSPENVKICGERQDHILECASKMLKAGGRLVYSTCTFAPLENEGSVSRFVKSHPEFEILPIDKIKLGLTEDEEKARLFSGRKDWTKDPAEGIENTLRLWPHLIKGEGHFVALLKKNNNPKEDICEDSKETKEKSKEKRKKQSPKESLCDIKKLREFMEDFLEEPDLFKLDPERIVSFGDNVYLLPEGMGELTGLKVLRPGLHLGTIKKERFEPSHSLALSLKPCEVKRVAALSEKEAKDYLMGLTLNVDGDNGWYLVSYMGCSLGFGKAVNGVLKNHYPKGLRKQV